MSATTERAGRTVQRRRPHYFHHTLYVTVERNARVLLRAIKANLGQTTFFQRQDVLEIPGLFTHISFISRYNNIGVALHFLVEQDDLVQLSRTDYALPNKAKRKPDEQPLQTLHLENLRGLVRNMPKGQPFQVMNVVNAWTTDTHLSLNTKRITVRHAMTQLVRERTCKQRNEFEFVV